VRRQLAAALVLAAAAVVGAACGSSTSSTTFQVNATQSSYMVAGPTILETDKYAGTFGGGRTSCTVTGPGPGAQCTITSLLPKGNIVSAGYLPGGYGQSATIAVVGGTGAYHAAAGTVHLAFTSPTETGLLFDLTIPN
jgi:hypothetical protein